MAWCLEQRIKYKFSVVVTKYTAFFDFLQSKLIIHGIQKFINVWG